MVRSALFVGTRLKACRALGATAQNYGYELRVMTF